MEKTAEKDSTNKKNSKLSFFSPKSMNFPSKEDLVEKIDKFIPLIIVVIAFFIALIV